MVDAQWNARIGATPGRLVLVAVLAVGLGIAVWLAPGTNDPRIAPRESRPTAAAPSKRATGKPGANRLPPRAFEQPLALEEALRHNPFALPTWAAPPAVALVASSDPEQAQQAVADASARQREQALAAVRARGVRMVLIDDDDRMAVIGGRLVRVGEVIDGCRVVAIEREGVTLQACEGEQN